MLQQMTSTVDLLESMDDIEEQTVFTLDELSSSSREAAIQAERDAATDDGWWELVYEDADKMAGILGFSIDRNTTRGGRSMGPAIEFSGFCSQGDGACFTGSWEPPPPGADIVATIKADATKDETLHCIADDFQRLANRCHGLGRVDAKIVRIHRGGSYSHSGMVTVEIGDDYCPEGYEDWHEVRQAAFEVILKTRKMDEFEDDLKTAARRFMDWIYKQLEEEYDGLTDEAYLIERLKEEGATFEEDGTRIFD